MWLEKCRSQSPRLGRESNRQGCQTSSNRLRQARSQQDPFLRPPGLEVEVVAAPAAEAGLLKLQFKNPKNNKTIFLSILKYKQ